MRPHELFIPRSGRLVHAAHTMWLQRGKVIAYSYCREGKWMVAKYWPTEPEITCAKCAREVEKDMNEP